MHEFRAKPTRVVNHLTCSLLSHTQIVMDRWTLKNRTDIWWHAHSANKSTYKHRLKLKLWYSKRPNGKRTVKWISQRHENIKSISISFSLFFSQSIGLYVCSILQATRSHCRSHDGKIGSETRRRVLRRTLRCEHFEVYDTHW